jgi:hypothetical protein
MASVIGFEIWFSFHYISVLQKKIHALDLFLYFHWSQNGYQSKKVDLRFFIIMVLLKELLLRDKEKQLLPALSRQLNTQDIF